MTQHKVYSLTDVASAQIIGTVQVCMSTALKGAKLISIHGGKQTMHLAARSVGSGIRKARPCHARPAQWRWPWPCEKDRGMHEGRPAADLFRLVSRLRCPGPEDGRGREIRLWLWKILQSGDESIIKERGGLISR